MVALDEVKEGEGGAGENDGLVETCEGGEIKFGISK